MFPCSSPGLPLQRHSRSLRAEQPGLHLPGRGPDHGEDGRDVPILRDPARK